jgi:DNA modification methylase
MEIGDARAAGPKMPSDVWDFPRVVGNSRERRDWHPTQHPESLYDRMLGFSCGLEDTAVDMFAGTGTIFRSTAKCQKIGIEIDSEYCQQISKEHKIPIEVF